MLKVSLSQFLSPQDSQRLYLAISNSEAARSTGTFVANQHEVDHLANYDTDGVSYDGTLICISGEARIPKPRFGKRWPPLAHSA